jgi:hypothetical protein
VVVDGATTSLGVKYGVGHPLENPEAPFLLRMLRLRVKIEHS